MCRDFEGQPENTDEGCADQLEAKAEKPTQDLIKNRGYKPPLKNKRAKRQKHSPCPYFTVKGGKGYENKA